MEFFNFDVFGEVKFDQYVLDMRFEAVSLDEIRHYDTLPKRLSLYRVELMGNQLKICL